MKVLATQAFIDLMNNPHARGVQFIAVEHNEGFVVRLSARQKQPCVRLGKAVQREQRKHGN